MLRRPRVTDALSSRLSPAYTRAPTMYERYTVRRWSWDTIVRLNAWLELVGKTATCIYCLTLAAVILGGVDLRPTIRGLLNGGNSVEHAFMLAVVAITLAFLLARGMVGWARWRLQRELWRRDVERFSGEPVGPRVTAARRAMERLRQRSHV